VTQRPLFVSQTWLPPQLSPPGCPQPGTHWLDSHTAAGAPHCESVVHPVGGSHRPVLRLQTLPPVHCRPPICVQPGMHWLDSQIVAGGVQFVSLVHVTWPGRQRPVVESQNSPSPQMIGDPGR
jgi:hypothetical protein